MNATRAGNSLATALVISTLLTFWATTLIVSAQIPSTGLTLENYFAAIRKNDTNTVSKMLEANTNLSQTPDRER